MQQRRLRLGDILDDYCPRERRITNHAVVAMIDDQVKQTRCTTCDADHEYKQARIPAPRRKKEPLVAASMPSGLPEDDQNEMFEDDAPLGDELPLEDGEASDVEAHEALEEQHAEGSDETAEGEGEGEGEAEDEAPGQREDDGPVHRRLIRATLPRPEGQSPERKVPEFTVRQPGGRGREFDGNRTGGGGGGGGQRQGRARRAARGPQGSFSGPSRFGGGPRQNTPQGQGGQRQDGNRPGPTGGQRGGGGRPQGQSRGPGRKRGR